MSLYNIIYASPDLHHVSCAANPLQITIGWSEGSWLVVVNRRSTGLWTVHNPNLTPIYLSPNLAVLAQKYLHLCSQYCWLHLFRQVVVPETAFGKYAGALAKNV